MNDFVVCIASSEVLVGPFQATWVSRHISLQCITEIDGEAKKLLREIFQRLSTKHGVCIREANRTRSVYFLPHKTFTWPILLKDLCCLRPCFVPNEPVLVFSFSFPASSLPLRGITATKCCSVELPETAFHPFYYLVDIGGDKLAL